MIKVAINSFPLVSGHANRGIGVYTKNLFAELKKRTDVSIQEFSNIDEVKNVDVVHYPYFDLFQHTLPNKKNFPTIVTIHDVIPLIFPKAYPLGIKARANLFLQKRSLKNVSGVLVNSECTKHDVARWLSVPDEKIAVTYLAASDQFKVIKDPKKLSEIRQKYNLPEKFVYYIGNVNWNKNILNLAKSCLEAKTDLVIIGESFKNKENLNHPELKSFKEFLEKYADNPLIHILGFIDNEDRVPITNLASVFLFPSFYEGFGIPVLEAQLCGVPIITSNVSSLPEVGGDGALYVDPNNSTEISEAITKILSDLEFSNDLIKKGFENAAKFSWKKCADQTVKVYSSLKVNL